jgi:hypothetical protein
MAGPQRARNVLVALLHRLCLLVGPGHVSKWFGASGVSGSGLDVVRTQTVFVCPRHIRRILWRGTASVDWRRRKVCLSCNTFRTRGPHGGVRVKLVGRHRWIRSDVDRPHAALGKRGPPSRRPSGYPCLFLDDTPAHRGLQLPPVNSAALRPGFSLPVIVWATTSPMGLDGYASRAC